MIYLERLLETIDFKEAIESVFEKTEIQCQIDKCLTSLPDSDIEYGWFKNSDLFIPILLGVVPEFSIYASYTTYGSVTGTGDYYIADDNLNFTFFESAQELVKSLEDYDLSMKEKKEIFKNLTL